MAFGELTAQICVQRSYLIAFIVVAAFQVTLSSSVIFGFSSLLVILKDMKLYQDVCPEPTPSNLTSSSIYSSEEGTAASFSCSARERALSLPFAIGMILHFLVKIPLGTFIDNIGAKSSQYIGCCLLMLFGMSLAYIEPGKEYLIYIAFVFLSLSSSLLMLCPYQVANILYKKRKAFFISLLSGCIDGSTVIFIIFLEIYQTNIGFQTICITYSVGSSCLLMIATTFLYPTKYVLQMIVDHETQANMRPEDTEDNEEISTRIMRSQDLSTSFMSSYKMYREAVLKSLEQLKETERREALLASLSQNLAIQLSNQSSYEQEWRFNYLPPRPYGTITEHSVGYEQDSYKNPHSYFQSSTGKKTEEKCALITTETKKSYATLYPFSGGKLSEYLFSKLNLFCIYALCVAMLKIVYFIGNLDKYLKSITDNETATSYIKYFGYVQFGGIIAAPLCSMLFMQGDSNEQLPADEDFVKKMKQLILPGFIYIFLLILLNALQLFESIKLSIVLYILYLFGNTLMWCYVSLFYAYLFPAKFYCTLFGLCMGICGVFTFIQYPLLIIEQKFFNGKQFWTNVLFLFLLLSTLVLPFYLMYLYNKIKTNITPRECEEKEKEDV